MANQRHHKDHRFVKAARLVRQAANANPRAVCWRCGRTLLEHEPRRSRKWSGGHTVDGVNGPPWLHVERRPPPGVWIAPEVFGECNVTAGNEARKRQASTGYDWP